VPDGSRGVCLVTGGAGFIGCALSTHLADRFDRVVAVDALHPQVHAAMRRPAALDARVELVLGDVTDPGLWDSVLGGLRPSTVVHLAAETGTAQSLTEATRHGSVNVVGTTEMLDALVRHGALPQRVLLTSSRAVYGEGAWADAHGVVHYPGQRTPGMLEAGEWDFEGLRPLRSDSSHTRCRPTSVYGATKLAQEHIVRAWCGSEGVLPLVFRMQNVYGPGQSLTNPHTGVVSFFAQVARSGGVVPVYEDGRITRDFVFIDDVVAALLRGLDSGVASENPWDIGSGRPTTVLEVARLVADHYGAPAPEVTGSYRLGDVRHAACEIRVAGEQLGWTADVDLGSGLRRLCEWIDATSPNDA
jgi:dTDP-L-rhamnose 4-epimerase